MALRGWPERPWSHTHNSSAMGSTTQPPRDSDSSDPSSPSRMPTAQPARCQGFQRSHSTSSATEHINPSSRLSPPYWIALVKPLARGRCSTRAWYRPIRPAPQAPTAIPAQSQRTRGG